MEFLREVSHLTLTVHVRCVCVCLCLECRCSVAAAAAAAALQTGLRFCLVVAVLHLENRDLDLRWNHRGGLMSFPRGTSAAIHPKGGSEKEGAKKMMTVTNMENHVGFFCGYFSLYLLVGDF